MSQSCLVNSIDAFQELLTHSSNVRPGVVMQQEVQESSPSSWYPAPVSVNVTGFCSPQWIHHLKRSHAKGCSRLQNLLQNVSRLMCPSGLPCVKRSRSQLWCSLGGMVSFWAFLILYQPAKEEIARFQPRGCPPTLCSMPRGALATGDKL